MLILGNKKKMVEKEVESHLSNQDSKNIVRKQQSALKKKKQDLPGKNPSIRTGVVPEHSQAEVGFCFLHNYL